MLLAVRRRYDPSMSTIPPVIDTAASIAMRTAAVPAQSRLAPACDAPRGAPLDWLGRLPPSEKSIPAEPLSAATADVDTLAAGVLNRLGS